MPESESMVEANQVFIGEGTPSAGHSSVTDTLQPSPAEVVGSLRQFLQESEDPMSPPDPIDIRIKEIQRRTQENYQKLIALLFLNSENGEIALFSRPQGASSVEQLCSQELSIYTGLYDLVGARINTMGELIDTIHPDDRERITNELMVEPSDSVQSRQFEFRLQKKFPDRDEDGKIIFTEDRNIQYTKPPEWRYVQYCEKSYTSADGKSQQWVSKLTDISEMADKMFHDQLTGVNNLRYFETFVRDKVVEMLYGDRNFALLMVDVDKLKPPNDYLGHAVGDKILKDVMRLLKDTLRESDIICRVGGDEIVILMERVRSEEDLKEILDRLQAAFNENQQYIHAQINKSPANSEIVSEWIQSGSIEVDDNQNQPESIASLPVGTNLRIRPMVSIGACFVPQITHPDKDKIFRGDPLKYLENLADMIMYEQKQARLSGTHYRLARYEPDATDDERRRIAGHHPEFS